MEKKETPDDPSSEEDPWKKLSPDERKRAERHLMILYVSMILMVVVPFFILLYLKK